MAALLALGAAGDLAAQSVRVTFRYQPPAPYVRVHFPGQFNNWGPNSGGTIAAGTPSQADSLEKATGLWVKTVTLNPGVYQYKIYRQLSSTPTDWSWIPDPLNRTVIPPDQNSQFTVDSLVLFQVCAHPFRIENNVFVVSTGSPSLSAGVFQPAGAPAAAITPYLDGAAMAGPGTFDTARGIYTILPPARLAEGFHVFKLVVSAGAKTRTDSVSFEVRSRAVQIQTPPFTTLKSTYITSGVVLKPDGSGPDSAIANVTVEVGSDLRSAAVVNGVFADSTPLAEGVNLIRVSSPAGVDSVSVTRIVDHRPYARSIAALQGGSVELSAASTTDPDGQTVSVFRWADDPAVPIGLNGQTGVTASVGTPAAPGEYFYRLIAEDPDGNADTTRGYFIIRPDGSLENPGIASNPAWAKQARVYFLFPLAASAAGTLDGAAAHIPRIKALGFNVIWMMPVMDNAYPIDVVGAGYNIVDFYNVAPEYGTNQDFKDFVAQAHAEGLKVILDVTPNHTGRFHPWAENARSLGTRSPYWGWYEHALIPHNTNGLGQSLDAFGFNYYSGFSDQLLNYNWRDLDAQAEMIRVYRYWIEEFGLDGYRFDVYWGPHRRYGELFMGDPVREALKKLKPDILLLGEDSGTGPGTEAIYADFSFAGTNGGVDAAYDFKLYFDRIRNFGFSPGAVDALHAEIDNAGYYPGPNSLYMRFMESQDEDRIYYLDPAPSTYYNASAPTAFAKTMPMATVIFTCPGFPMIWNGQEVGWGYGIPGNKHARTRSVIDWEFQGKGYLSPHYQRLAHARGQFAAFTQHRRDTNQDGTVNGSDSSDFIRIPTGNGSVYAFSRPYPDENGLAVANFSASPVDMTIPIPETALSFSGGLNPASTYYINEFVQQITTTTTAVTGADIAAGIRVALPAYGSAVYVVSTEPETLKVDDPVLNVPGDAAPIGEYELRQNYPNPFNPATVIQFTLAGARHTTVKVYDLLGREVAVLVDEMKAPGRYEIPWDATGLASGIYVYRLTAGDFAESRTMVLLK
jgi:glycosidase